VNWCVCVCVIDKLKKSLDFGTDESRFKVNGKA